MNKFEIGDEITIDGVKYIRADTVKKQEKKPLTGYERAKRGNTYWKDSDGDVYANIECDIDRDYHVFGVANYYTNKTIALNNARADRLMRRLRQWQALNDDVCVWCHDDDSGKWRIEYSYEIDGMYSADVYHHRDANVIYFSTEEKADEAIEVFHDELTWYFTEYQQRLDE